MPAAHGRQAFCRDTRSAIVPDGGSLTGDRSQGRNHMADINGIAAGPIVVEVTKQKGLAEVAVEVADRPISVEMDGYANLRWLSLVQDLSPLKEPNGGE